MYLLVTVQDKASQTPAEPMLLDTERVSISQWIHANLGKNDVILIRRVTELEQLPEP